MSVIITGVNVLDVRFPTSRDADGSDAMNKDPDYSATYVTLTTDQEGLEGNGLTFTIGRGNEICCLAVEALKPLIVGRSLAEIIRDMGKFWREFTGDSQLRWIGPDKGVIHLATGAVINAVWDLWAKFAQKPVWKLIAEMSPEEIVRCIDFRYITDALTPDEALEILESAEKGKIERIKQIEQEGYPAYTTSAGWLGYNDEKMRRLCKEAVDAGWSVIKLKVGLNLEEDIRRCRIAREELGSERRLFIDANQVWEVDQAIEWVNQLKEFNPWFIEEPVSPDDILGHKKVREGVAPIKVATGEMCQNRVIFKQLIQSDAIDVVQIDSCRVGGVNENLAIMLMAAKYNKLVCPHAGGIGLCELVQHLSMVDYICISGSMEDRVLEYVDHLHEHFIDPCVIKNGRYQAPAMPGFSITMKLETIKDYIFPNGKIWAT